MPVFLAEWNLSHALIIQTDVLASSVSHSAPVGGGGGVLLTDSRTVFLLFYKKGANMYRYMQILHFLWNILTNSL